MPNSTNFRIICVESNYCLLFELDHFNSKIPSLQCFEQLLGREGIDEMIESIVTGTTQVGDHNWIRKKLRSIEDLWGTLVDVHGQVGHGGRQRMDKHLRGHGTHVHSRPVI